MASLFFLTAIAIAIATNPFKFHENSVAYTSSSFVSSIHSLVLGNINLWCRYNQILRRIQYGCSLSLPIELSYLAEISANQMKSIFCVGADMSGRVGGATSHLFCRFSIFGWNFCNSVPRYDWIRRRRRHWLHLFLESYYVAEFSANRRKSIFCAGAAVSGGVGGATSHPSVLI